MPKEDKLKLMNMKGYKGYVWEGFKKLAETYDNVQWGKGTMEPKEVIKTPFKTTYKF